MHTGSMVSISCTTYNHEKYIADAIDSFLMQKTDFTYEILIHDDASTDGTQAIIKKYELRYPDLIKPIYQTENQYSKGVKVGGFNRERARGKYIAICEGDDYWTDPFKLQKQVNYMESNPDCSLCVHAAKKVRPDKSELISVMRPNRGNKIFTVEETILGGGELFATNSIMYPAVFKGNRPAFLEDAPVGDYPLVIFLALQGTVYYIDEIMSAYRVAVPGSWTERTVSDINEQTKVYEQILEMLKEINIYSGFKYEVAIKKKIQEIRLKMTLKKILHTHFPEFLKYSMRLREKFLG